MILRLDYAGVTDLNKLVDVFDKKFPKAFKERNLVINREINVTLHKKDLEEIGKTLSLPVSIIEKSQVIRYAQLKNINPTEADALLAKNKAEAMRRYTSYQRYLEMDFSK